MVALGPSSISFVDGLYACNPREIEPWSEAIESGKLATCRGFELNDDDKLRRAVIMTIMCRFELDKREKEVNRREMQVKAAEMLSAKGLSRDLASVLKYDDEKELEAAIEMIGNMQGAKAETKPDQRLIIENKLSDTYGTGSV
jgi:coproporphyrinogen III oxidase-like Fe-S oxidoreductase